MHPVTPYYVVWALLVYAWIANYLVRMALGALCLVSVVTALALGPPARLRSSPSLARH
jgi:hypothetical protein